MRQLAAIGLSVFVIGFWASASAAQRLAVLGFLERGGPRANQGAALTLSIDLDTAFTRRQFKQLEADSPGDVPDAKDPLFGEIDDITAWNAGLESGELMLVDEARELRQEWFGSLAQSGSSSGSAASPAPMPSALPPTLPKERGFHWDWSEAFLRQLVTECVTAQARSLELYETAATRARYAALLPDLTLRFGRNTDRSLRLTPTEADPERYQLTGGYDYKLEAQASWEFSRLVFSDQEVSLGRLRHWVSAAQRDVTKQALSAAFRWQKAEVTLAEGTLLPEERLQSTLERAAAEGELNVLSGGWFARHRREAWLK